MGDLVLTCTGEAFMIVPAWPDPHAALYATLALAVTAGAARLVRHSGVC
jgi:hypothetical protein